MSNLIKGYVFIEGNNLNEAALRYNHHLVIGMDFIKSCHTLAEKIEAERWFKERAQRLLEEARESI